MIVRISANERATKRANALAEILARHPDRYTVQWESYDTLGIDLVIGNVGFELKEADDFVSSLLNGHLANQRRAAKKMGIPCFVIIFGSPEDVRAAIPRQTTEWRTDDKMNREWHRVLDGYASLAISGFTPLHLSKDHKTTMEYVVDIATSAEGTHDLPSIKAESPAVAMLQCLPGVGHKLSRQIEQHGFRLVLAATVVTTSKTKQLVDYKIITDPGILRIVPGMGAKTAAAIIRAVYPPKIK